MPMTTKRILYHLANKSRKNKNPAVINSTVPLNILSLSQLQTKRRQQNPRRLFQLNSPKIFEIGIDPQYFKLHIFIFFKYSHWLQNSFACQRLQAFQKQYTLLQAQSLKLLTKQPENIIKIQKQLSLVHQYRRHFAVQIIPLKLNTHYLGQTYLNQLQIFLKNTIENRIPISAYELSSILINFQKIMFDSQGQTEFANKKDNAWQLQNIFSMYLDLYVPIAACVPISSKQNIIKIAKNLRVFNLRYLQYLKSDLQRQKKDITLQSHLTALIYLAMHSTFPFEYFYRQKRNLLGFLQAAHNLSQKKVSLCLSMLQLFARQRLMYCEQIIDKLVTCLQENLSAADVTKIARIFMFYSRLKYGIKQSFMIKLVERIYIFKQELQDKEYAMIINAVARMNYQNQEFVKLLKEHNYQMFLTQLKYGSVRLGKYFQTILDQVENKFKSQGRIEAREDEPFQQIFSQNLQQMQSEIDQDLVKTQ